MNDTKILTDNNVDLNKSLELFGDMKTYNQMLEEFLSQVDGKLKEAEKFKNISDLVNYEVIVHSLKSDFKYFGAFDTAELFYKHELAAKEPNPDFINQDFNHLIEEATRMINVFKKYMGADIQVTANSASVPPVQIANTINGKTIIVVDDSNIIRTFAEKVFKDEYNVVLAKDGEEAISLVSNSNRDNIMCMLLDLNMPRVNGFEVLDYFKNNNLFEEVPVSIITGMNDEETIRKAFAYPIIDMIQKPFSEEKVRDVTIKTIARKANKGS